MTTPRLKAWGNTKIIPIACIFVFNEAGELLLLQRHSEDLGGGRWGTPGGRLDMGEDASAAAVRELREETGIEAPSIDLLGSHEVRMPHGTVHMTSFKTAVPNNIDVVVDPVEHHSYAWIGLDNLLSQAGLLWGTPTILKDFGVLSLEIDPTLADGSKAILLELAES